MSLKFAIKSVAGQSVKEGDEIVRFTGTDEVFRIGSERACRKTGELGEGKDKQTFVSFTTGLDVDLVDYYQWYNEEEKEQVKKFITENKPKLETFYKGASVLAHDNKYFWTSKDVFKLFVDNYKIDKLFDTKNPEHCLTYLGIIAGAWMDLVAPTKEWAELNPGIPFYLALENEATESDSEVFITKLQAQAALSEISEQSGDGLFILAWCTQYDSTSYGAFSRVGTPRAELIKYHSMFIDGLIPTKRNAKKNYPKVFLEYANKWKGQQTKALVMTEAYLKAGEFYGFVNSSKKKYVTDEGTVLGNSIADAVKSLMEPKHIEDLERLRDKVEKKWNE